jgi:hypothetical protein
MITCEWMGRLGNVMFQIAVTYALADKYKVKPQFKWQPHFDLPERTREPEHVYVQSMGNNSVIDIPYKPNLSIVGFFQRHEYFDHIREKLIKEVFKVPIDWQPDTIAVHVRRGDFVLDPVNFPTQPVSYYMDALERIGYKDKRVVFCSDDIKWCEDNFKHIENAKFRIGTTPIEDIFFMANCDAVVMSNSTFSFWGAYLSLRDRPIYFPLHWFDINSGRDGYEICLKEWIGL